MAFDDRRDECLPAWEILIERTDADARRLRDAVGARLVETLPDQNASGRLYQHVDCGTRSGLGRFLPGFCEWVPCHFSTLRMRVVNASDRSYFLHIKVTRNS